MRRGGSLLITILLLLAELGLDAAGIADRVRKSLHRLQP